MSWQKDVADIRAINKKGGERGLAQLYGRVVAQIGAAKCAAEVGVSVTTVRRYTKTLDLLADAGYIAHVKDFTADTDYDFDAIGVTQTVWDETYEAMRYTRADGKKVSKRQPGQQEVLDALDDPRKEVAAREKLARIDARRRMDRATSQHKEKDKSASVADLLEDWYVADGKVTKALANLLTETINLPKDAVSRGFMEAALAETRQRTLRYLDAIESQHKGASMDDELAELLSDGAL